jgi:hypothetical protein
MDGSSLHSFQDLLSRLEACDAANPEPVEPKDCRPTLFEPAILGNPKSGNTVARALSSLADLDFTIRTWDPELKKADEVKKRIGELALLVLPLEAKIPAEGKSKSAEFIAGAEAAEKFWEEKLDYTAQDGLTKVLEENRAILPALDKSFRRIRGLLTELKLDQSQPRR